MLVPLTSTPSTASHGDRSTASPASAVTVMVTRTMTTLLRRCRRILRSAAERAVRFFAPMLSRSLGALVPAPFGSPSGRPVDLGMCAIDRFPAPDFLTGFPRVDFRAGSTDLAGRFFALLGGALLLRLRRTLLRCRHGAPGSSSVEPDQPILGVQFDAEPLEHPSAHLFDHSEDVVGRPTRIGLDEVGVFVRHLGAADAKALEAALGRSAVRPTDPAGW